MSAPMMAAASDHCGSRDHPVLRRVWAVASELSTWSKAPTQWGNALARHVGGALADVLEVFDVHYVDPARAFDELAARSARRAAEIRAEATDRRAAS